LPTPKYEATPPWGGGGKGVGVLPHIWVGESCLQESKATFPFQVAKNPKATWRVRGRGEYFFSFIS